MSLPTSLLKPLLPPSAHRPPSTANAPGAGLVILKDMLPLPTLVAFGGVLTSLALCFLPSHVKLPFMVPGLGGKLPIAAVALLPWLLLLLQPVLQMYLIRFRLVRSGRRARQNS